MEVDPNLRKYNFLNIGGEKDFSISWYLVLSIHYMHDAMLGGISFQSVSENLYFIGASE